MDRAHLLDDRAGDLATAVGHLPLALSHAAAYMIIQEEGCTAYVARYATGAERLAELMPASADPDAYGRPVAVTLLLALEAADTAEPAGLARPALAVAAVCDPDGHPDTLWATTPVTSYLSAHRAGGPGVPVTADQARKALRLLHRYGLLTHTPADGARAVRIHALTARAARENHHRPGGGRPRRRRRAVGAMAGQRPRHYRPRRRAARQHHHPGRHRRWPALAPRRAPAAVQGGQQPAKRRPAHPRRHPTGTT
jgi:hypothetical protein